MPRSGPIVQDLRAETVNAQRAQMTLQKSTSQILNQTAAERVSQLSRMVNHHESGDESDSDNDDDAYLKQLRAVMKKDWFHFLIRFFCSSFDSDFVFNLNHSNL